LVRHGSSAKRIDGTGLFALDSPAASQASRQQVKPQEALARFAGNNNNVHTVGNKCASFALGLALDKPT
jgi:hypothetical protein